MKNKLFIIINVLGMGMGISYCIVAYFAFQYDATFDGVHKNRSTIYRVSAVREFENKLTRFGYAPLPLREVVEKNFSDVNKSTRYFHPNRILNAKTIFSHPTSPTLIPNFLSCLPLILSPEILLP